MVCYVWSWTFEHIFEFFVSLTSLLWTFEIKKLKEYASGSFGLGPIHKSCNQATQKNVANLYTSICFVFSQMICNKIKYTNNLKNRFAFSELFCSADDILNGDSLFLEAGSPNTSTVARAKQTLPTRPKCPQRNSHIWLNNFRCTVPKEIYFPR